MIISTPWTDNELLQLMYYHEVRKFPFEQCGRKLNRSRNSCAGAYFRIVNDLNLSEGEDDRIPTAAT